MARENNKNLADFNRGIFVKQSAVDYAPLKKWLGRLIAERLEQFPKNSGSEEKNILTAIQATLNQDKMSKAVLEDKNSFSFSPQEWHWLAKHEEAQWLEYLIYRYRFKIYPRQKKLTDFPLYLLIEPTSICNLNCPMCFQSDASFRKKEFMGMISWELFTGLVATLARYSFLNLIKVFRCWPL